jgi:hypothetical protein
MKQEKDDIALAQKVKTVLDHDIAQMDERIVGRLRKIRRTAMSSEEGPARLHWPRLRLSLAGVAIGLLVAVIGLNLARSPNQTMPAYMMEDLDIITSAENRELFDDLEFYAWLVEENEYEG